MPGLTREQGTYRDFVHGSYGRNAGNAYSEEYAFPKIPDANTGEATLWEAWYNTFDQVPIIVSDELAKLAAKGEIEAVTEAMTITRAKPIYGGVEAVKYIFGILRYRQLQHADPARAAKMKEFFSLRRYWEHQPHGRGYLNKALVLRWLDVCTADEIKAVMDSVGGYWADLAEEMDRIVESRRNAAVNTHDNGVTVSENEAS